jgi:NNP family nitrate/nitrite transporter-like MFS transporter
MPSHQLAWPHSAGTGWGNTGAGAALLLTPLLYEAFARLVAPDIAWRIALFVPGVLQLLLGVLVLTAADDSPLGSFPQLRCAR